MTWSVPHVSMRRSGRSANCGSWSPRSRARVDVDLVLVHAGDRPIQLSATRRSATSANDGIRLRTRSNSSRAGELAAAFAEIGEGVPEAQVMVGRTLHAVAAPFEQRDRVPQAAAIRKRPREHDAAFGDERRPTATLPTSSSHSDSTRAYLPLRSRSP